MYQDIKSFDDACKNLKLDPTKVVPEGLEKDEKAYIKLKIITKALNGKWVPDFDNSSEYKYWPWFRLSGGFSCNGYDSWCASTGASSRLCFRSREVAEYAGETFLELFKDYFVIDK